MSSATASTTSVRLRDIKSLTRQQQVYVGVILFNLVSAGVVLGLYTNGSVSSPELVLAIGGGNLVVGGLGLRAIDDMLREVSA